MLNKQNAAAQRQVRFDPALAADIAERLAQGLHPSLIAMQLAGKADQALVEAYAKKALDDPFFKGAVRNARAQKKRDWILNCQAKAWKMKPAHKEIPRCHQPSPEKFLTDFYANQRPAVLTGLVDDWPALSKWNADYLEDKVGRETLVEAQKGRTKKKNFERNKLQLKSKIPFGELADLLRSGEETNDLYVTANNGSVNRQAFDPLWQDFHPVPGIISDDKVNDGFLWIGPKGTITPFHHDLTNNFLVQVKGRKSIHMVPSWEEARMKPVGGYFSDWSLEGILENPENSPPVLHAEIGPGDVLFIPVGWWHHVVGLEESYTVLFTNFVWDNDFTGGFPEPA